MKSRVSSRAAATPEMTNTVTRSTEEKSTAFSQRCLSLNLENNPCGSRLTCSLFDTQTALPFSAVLSEQQRSVGHQLELVGFSGNLPSLPLTVSCCELGREGLGPARRGV